jgi:fructoselysine-6-P-deglycase FrlB-like protein
MLDADLAMLYGVKTKVLNQAVKRNLKRFPNDFMFQLTAKEKNELVTNCDHLSTLKFSPQSPYAFTEQGVAMLSSVLNSERAIMVNIQIMRAFTKLKREILTYAALKRKIDDMEKKYDTQFRVVFQAIKQLMIEEEKPKPRIGFRR